MNSLLLSCFLVLGIARFSESSLLEMSRDFWNRVLDGGYEKIGPLDPLLIPVVKIDQSQGNLTYRVVLKNLQIFGLNESQVESVQVVRGSLKSNLSDQENGYVSYNQERDLDSIRYRFHTLVKERANERNEAELKSPSERVMEFDPVTLKARVEEDGARNFSGNATLPQRPEMRIVFNQAHPQSPPTVRVVYAQNYQSNERPCVGACRQNEGIPSNHRPDDELTPPRTNETPRVKLRTFGVQNQRTDPVVVITREDLVPITTTTPKNNYRFSVQTGNSRVSFGEQGVKAQHGQSEFSFSDQSQTRVKAYQGTQHDLKADLGLFGYSEKPSSVTPPNRQPSPNFHSSEINEPFVSPVLHPQFEGPAVSTSEFNMFGNSGPNFFPEHRSPFTNSPELTERFKRPLERLEKQEGYVDIVYAEPKVNATVKVPRVETVTQLFQNDSDSLTLDRIIKTLRENRRYIIHNFTEGESLRKRNDAVRARAESRRIKDLLRYAKEFEEKNGYYEEGMELVYHFGFENSSAAPRSAPNQRTKRADPSRDQEDAEDEVMHIIARIRVPRLRVRANYELMGKVGQQPLRGAGLLAGNFTDLVGDFTVELKRVENRTLVVRAARARLLATGRSVRLQGMNEKGPVQAILRHGIMAAEAVAAMVVDDLATKALSDRRNADGLIYKMYKNVPH